MALRKKKTGQSKRERAQLETHLDELMALRDDRLRNLGALAGEMQRRGALTEEPLWSRAAELTAIDAEVKLVLRGLEEGLTLDELEEIGRT